jgi:hypothetical protein
MIGTHTTGRIQGVHIEARSFEGLRVTANGRPARLAIVDENGRVIAAGADVASEAEAAAINGWRAVLKGEGVRK